MCNNVAGIAQSGQRFRGFQYIPSLLIMKQKILSAAKLPLFSTVIFFSAVIIPRKFPGDTCILSGISGYRRQLYTPLLVAQLLLLFFRCMNSLFQLSDIFVIALLSSKRVPRRLVGIQELNSLA